MSNEYKSTVTIPVPKDEYIEYTKLVKACGHSIIEYNNKVFLDGIKEEVENFEGKETSAPIRYLTIKVSKKEYDKHLEVLKARKLSRTHNIDVFRNRMHVEMKELRKELKKLKKD